MVVLQRLLNLEEKLVCDSILRSQIVQEEQLLLQGSLRAVIVGDEGAQGTGDQVEGDNAGKHERNAVDALQCGPA